jgi:hypothetical protein
MKTDSYMRGSGCGKNGTTDWGQRRIASMLRALEELEVVQRTERNPTPPTAMRSIHPNCDIPEAAIQLPAMKSAAGRILNVIFGNINMPRV